MVIDLDARRPASVPPARRRGRDARPVAIVAVLLVALTLGGSAAPWPGPRPVLAVENTSGVFAMAPAALFTADFGPAPGRQATVRRHSLHGSSPAWSADLPQTVGSLDVAGSARVLVVRPAQVLMTTSVDSPQTTFLDSETGETLWRTRTHSVLRVADTSVLMTGSAALRRADLRTGRLLWSRDLGSTVYLDPGDPAAGPPGRIVLADRHGDAVVLDFADGAVLARAKLGAASPAAYRLSDLHQVWRRTMASPGPASRCGPDHLCVATATGPAVLTIHTAGDLATVVPDRCAANAGFLACPTRSGRLTVWRLTA